MMLNPIKVDRFFKLERRFGNKKKLLYMKIFSIQENSSFNRIEWKTEADVLSEKFRHYKNRYWYIISPFSVFRHVWDSLMTIFYLSFIFMLPLRVQVVLLETNPTINLTQIPVDLFFLISIPINFFTGIYRSSTRTITYKPSTIARTYLKGFLIVDLLSSIPYDCFISTSEIYGNKYIPTYVYLLYFLYYLKLIRFGTFLTALRKLFYFLHLRGIIAEIISIVLVWFTISYYLLSTLYFSGDYEMENKRILSSDPLGVLLFIHNTTNFIFSLSSRLSVTPDSFQLQDLGQMVILFVTILIEPFIAAVVIVLYWSTSDSDIKYRAVVDEVNSYTNALSAPDQTKKKIKDYFKMYHDQSLLMDDRKAMDFYSGHDQMQILSHMMNKIAMKVELFRDLPPRLRLEMVKKLKREVMFAGYKLTMAGQIGSKMHIVSTGKLLMLTSNSIKISEVGEGSSLGEYQLLVDSPYPLTTICAEITTIYTLDRSSFNSVIYHLTDLYMELREKITERHMNLILAVDKLKRTSL